MQLRKCHLWSWFAHLVKNTIAWPPVARGHAATPRTNWKIRNEKICFQYKLEWLELHLYYLKWELVTCQPPPVLASGRNITEISLWLVISLYTSYSPFLENLMDKNINLLMQMHLRFVMHNRKLSGVSEIQDSALRNMEGSNRNWLKMNRNEENHLQTDKLYWLGNLIAFAKKSDH